jgi:hypothetical protein
MKARVPITYRRGSWEAKKGQGKWRWKYTADLSEKQVRKNLMLEYPGAAITRYRIPTNGKK